MPNRDNKMTARRTPTQGRAIMMVDTILQATIELIKKNGYSSLTTNGIAKYAGVSIGSLYQYFPNKESIVNALYENTISDIATQYRDAIFNHISDNVEATIPDVIDIVLSLYETNKLVLIDLPEEVPHLRNTAKNLSLDILIQSANRVYIAQHFPHLSGENKETKIYFSCNTFLESIKSYVRNQPKNIPRDTFILNLSEMIAAYLALTDLSNPTTS